MPTTADQVLRRLSEGSASSSELEQLVGQSQSTLSRVLRALVADEKVIRLGNTRGARYAQRRDREGIGSRWPLRRIDENGAVHELGVLNALAANQFFLEAATKQFAWGGLTDGLPYYLQDQRPAGFLGRAVPRRYPELALPQRVVDWNEDHYLRYLTQRGSDTVGNLVLGDAALDEALRSMHERAPIRAADRAQRYPQLVSDIMEGGLPGSPAHGEHPKFVTYLDPQAPYAVLVKFSPPVTTQVGQRWSDLLIAEHLAHEILRGGGVASAQSRIDRFSDRTYLETVRFDRAGRDGRIGVTSMLAIDAELHGKLDNWIDAAKRLHADRRIAAETVSSIRLLATFGTLIANTDRHLGNLAFYDHYDGKFALAPVYDMLPMLCAPEHDEISARTFTPVPPSADSLNVYGRARSLAEQYWSACVGDDRISAEFRRICATNLESLRSLPRAGAFSAAST
jgi:hypothetical protein